MSDVSKSGFAPKSDSVATEARLAAVRTEIEAAARISGRAPETIDLLAVSKGHPGSAIAAMAACGVRDFGENYAQELALKSSTGSDAGLPADVRWHFIGHLQTNKVKTLVPHLAAVHSVDCLALVDALEKHAALAKGPVRLFAQLVVDPADANKSGADLPEAEALCERLGAIRAPYEWAGFMGIGPAGADAVTLRTLYEDFVRRGQALWATHNPRATNGALPAFSLGMSGDLPPAIAAGSTLVRIGTALFGRRAPRAPANV